MRSRKSAAVRQIVLAEAALMPSVFAGPSGIALSDAA